jgi:hypothetical protein
VADERAEQTYELKKVKRADSDVALQLAKNAIRVTQNEHISAFISFDIPKAIIEHM